MATNLLTNRTDTTTQSPSTADAVTVLQEVHRQCSGIADLRYLQVKTDGVGVHGKVFVILKDHNIERDYEVVAILSQLPNLNFDLVPQDALDLVPEEAISVIQ